MFNARINIMRPQEILRFLNRGVRKFKIASRTMPKADLVFYLDRIIPILTDENRNTKVSPVNDYFEQFQKLDDLTNSI